MRAFSKVWMSRAASVTFGVRKVAMTSMPLRSRSATANTTTISKLTMTAVIDEDDDSGYGVNPRISAQLLAGDYYVQIRHHESSGTGKYTIVV